MSDGVDVDFWGSVADFALGTTQSEGALAERFEVEVDDEFVMERLLDHGVERCIGCGWWVESSEFVEAEHGDLVCGDCA